jgi:hypothetical protein
MEDRNIVPSKQYGSREGHQCISAILNKQLTHDIVQHTKTVTAFLENDAQGCYDRIVNNLLLLELQCLGMPKMTITALHNTWANAHHHVKTKYGISQENYKNTEECPLFGPGQGSTAGPFFWLLLFAFIVNSLSPLLVRTTVISADKQIASSDTGEAFVDDSSLGCTSMLVYDKTKSMDRHQALSKENVILNLQVLGQQWEHLLYATGGAL